MDAEIRKWKRFAPVHVLHVCNTVRIHVDGVEVTGERNAGNGYDPPFTGLLPVRIANMGDLTQLLIGEIHEARIYDRILTPAEIQDLMRGIPIEFELAGDWLK